jgi:hypothetical protein
MASKFFFKTFVTIPLAPIITGIIIHFMFNIYYYYYYYYLCVWELSWQNLGVCSHCVFAFILYLLELSSDCVKRQEKRWEGKDETSCDDQTPYVSQSSCHTDVAPFSMRDHSLIHWHVLYSAVGGWHFELL